jgi:hypothetical protein
MKLILCLLSVISFSISQQRFTVADLAWLTGHWEMIKGERRTEEVWLAPAGNKMFSISRTVKGGKAIEHEFITIDQDSAGVIYFHAKPSGQEGGSFPLVSLQDQMVIFENPAHDFPQRIIYRKISEDSLIGRIEGTINGKQRGIDFPYRKIRN